MYASFYWDLRKAAANERKHGVTFSEPKSVFSDPLAKMFEDQWHSHDEDREIIIGHSKRGRLLMVCFTEIFEGAIRIISARPLTTVERRDFQEHE